MSRNSRQRQLAQATRRQMLGMIGSTALVPVLRNPIATLINGLVDGLISKAQADTALPGVKPRNFIYLNIPGAPPRWVFDLPLTPYAGAPFGAHPQVASGFSDSGTTYAGQRRYATVPITRNGVTLQMPTLWGCTLPTAGGGTVPMGDLLSNMLMIRGVDLQQDGHATQGIRAIRPLASAASLNGLVADGSSAPISAVALYPSPGSAYKSAKGLGQVAPADVSMYTLSQILGGFDRSGDALPAGYLSRRAAMDLAIKSALQKLGDYAKSSIPGAESLDSARSSAESLLVKGIGNLAAEYSVLYTKYRGLIQACAQTPIPGVSDKPVRLQDMIGYGGFTKQTKTSQGPFVNNPDLRTVIQSSSTLMSLAEGMAITEYLIRNGYSNSVMCGVAAVAGLNFVDIRQGDTPTQAGPTDTNGFWYADEHQGGSVTSLLVNSFMYRAVSACLFELIASLKAGGLFDETVIQVGSEFARTPDMLDESGTNHGTSAQCVSLFSGAIDRPIVLGNTAVFPVKIPAGQPYAGENFAATGAWGSAAPVKVDGAVQTLTIGHMTSTIAQLLRVKPILTNNGTLVVENAGKIVPTVDLATNIEVSLG